MKLFYKNDAMKTLDQECGGSEKHCWQRNHIIFTHWLYLTKNCSFQPTTKHKKLNKNCPSLELDNDSTDEMPKKWLCLKEGEKD